MKKFILVFPVIFFVAVSCSTQQKIDSNELKLEGKIQEVSNLLPVDGSLTAKINGVWVMLEEGGMRATPDEATRGNIIGLDLGKDSSGNIGKKAEVFCSKINASRGTTCTIIGNSKYYFKVID